MNNAWPATLFASAMLVAIVGRRFYSKLEHDQRDALVGLLVLLTCTLLTAAFWYVALSIWMPLR